MIPMGQKFIAEIFATPIFAFAFNPESARNEFTFVCKHLPPMECLIMHEPAGRGSYHCGFVKVSYISVGRVVQHRRTSMARTHSEP